MRPYPQVEFVYLTTLVRNLLLIEGEDFPDIAIVEQSRAKKGDFSPKIKSIMKMINKVYSLYAKHDTLADLNLEEIILTISPPVHGWQENEYSKYEELADSPAELRSGIARPPANAFVSHSKIKKQMETWLSKAKALDDFGGDEERAAFAWLSPYRMSYISPFQDKNFLAGIGLFLYLRMHWKMPFFLYDLNRAEVAETQRAYSLFWIQKGLWETPDFPPLFKEKKEKLIGTD